MICGSHPEIIVASTFNDNLIRVTGEGSSIYLQLIGRTSSSSGAGVKAMTQGVAKGHTYRVLSFRWIRHPTTISYYRIYSECFENKLWLLTCRTYVLTSTHMARRLKIYTCTTCVEDVNASSWDFAHRLFEERHFEENLSSS